MAIRIGFAALTMVLAIALNGTLGLVYGEPTAHREATPAPVASSPASATAPVDIFAAIKAGQVDVKLVLKDSSQGKMLIENRGQQPLTIKLPEAFAGVQVLAQIGGRAGGVGGVGGAAQPVGGGAGGGLGGGGLGGGGGGGMFMLPAERAGEIRVLPGKTGEVRVPCVCLEHGKPEPRSTMKYEVRPINEVSDKPAIRELCQLLGHGKIDQRVAQAAAWHLNNGMTWEQLSSKQIKPLVGDAYPYFSADELRAAVQVTEFVELAAARSAAAKPVVSPGEQKE